MRKLFQRWYGQRKLRRACGLVMDRYKAYAILARYTVGTKSEARYKQEMADCVDAGVILSAALDRVRNG